MTNKRTTVARGQPRVARC